MSVRHVAVFAALLLFSGCAIHPLPEDVTGVSTYQIVRQIRCEARDTIRKDVITWLGRLNSSRAQSLAAQYQENPASISNFSPKLFNTPDLVSVRAVVQLFYDTGIAYNFDLDMTEDNNLTGGASFQKPYSNAKLTFGPTATANRKRDNERIFTVTDTFSYLLTKVPEQYCNGYVVEANYIYPIAGRVGVDKIVDDFIDLTLFADLAGTKDKPAGPPTMVDQLAFTTVISASVNPMVVFTPVTSALNITNASLTGLADRTDTHKVAIALAIATSGITDLDPVRMGLFSSNRGALVVGRSVTGGGSPSEKLAVAAIDQVKSREVKLIPVQ
jgi:hypothetical protein